MKAAARQFITMFANERDRLWLIIFGGTAIRAFPYAQNFKTASPSMDSLIGSLTCFGNTSMAQGLSEAYLDLAESFKLPARIPFPRQEAKLDHLPPIIGNTPPETAKQIGRADQRILAARAIKSTDHFVATFYAETVSVPFLKDILASLTQGSCELMTHPGLLDDQLRKESQYTLRREDELAVLTNSQVIEYLDRLDIQLITFADL